MPLAEGVAAGDNEVMLCIHVIDQRRVGIPGFYNVEGNRVQDIDGAILGCSTDMSASFHYRVVFLGRYLRVQ